MEKLVEGVLADGALHAPHDRYRGVIQNPACAVDALAVRLHLELLQVCGQQAQRARIRQHRVRRSAEEIAVPHPDQRHQHRDVLLERRLREVAIDLVRAGQEFLKCVETHGARRGEADALGDGALEVRFAANADPRDLERALEGADPKTTLFVVVSKTFTTPETMSNAAAAKKWGGKVFYAVTSNVEAAKQFGASEILPMWDWVGGRFSVWSAVGFAAACAMGFDGFQEFLAGAHDIDRHFAQAPLEKNVPVLMAAIGVWNGNFLGASTHAVLPYSNALRLLPAYLQQLELELNGQRVDREARVLNYSTVPVVWGMEGTVSQHSFHQLLHQGTQIVPADFIDLSLGKDLSANALAQADALAFGTDDPKLAPFK